ncbi:MAG: GGDEF domain-containing protein [Pseudonocardia sp.]
MDIARRHIDRSDLFAAGMLCVLGVVHTEIAVGLERVRRQVADAPHGDLSSVWTFAGAVLLPPVLGTFVVLVIFTHRWLRVWRSVGVPGYRHLFSTATVVLACHAALAVVRYSGTVPLRELATLCLGGVVAIALDSHPWQVPLVMAPLLVLHRALLVRQPEEAASTDSKTGLLNAAAWHLRASMELRRAQRGHTSAALLILDLDHFKSVNDDHGHLAGDQVLRAVAGALRGEVRPACRPRSRCHVPGSTAATLSRSCGWPTRRSTTRSGTGATRSGSPRCPTSQGYRDNVRAGVSTDAVADSGDRSSWPESGDPYPDRRRRCAESTVPIGQWWVSGGVWDDGLERTCRSARHVARRSHRA